MTEPTNNLDQTDLDVADLIADMVTLLTGAPMDRQEEVVEVKGMRGDKLVKFVICLRHPKDAGVVIGRSGGTIQAMRLLVSKFGGAFRRFYDLDLDNDRDERGGRRDHGAATTTGKDAGAAE